MQNAMSFSSVVPEQIAHYQTDELITQDVCAFDPTQVIGRLQGDQEILAIDIGGDKLRSARYRIANGAIATHAESTFQSRSGAGYLPVLETLADQARADDIPVGISVAIKMNGSRVGRTVNLPVLFDELTTHYDGDFANLFPHRAFVANDTVTGICGATGRLAMEGVSVDAAAFVISASGMGGSVLRDGIATHVEVGHVAVEPDLNPLGQTTPCGVEGRSYVCVERVTAGRAGIENLHQHITGEAIDGVSLGKRYEHGDPLSTMLYQTSASALAHAVAGVYERYRFDDATNPAIILHGGNFEISRYRDDVDRVLRALPQVHCRVAYSRVLSSNVCLDGAALLALVHG